MGKAKSPATPKTLVIPMSLSLDRTWSITVVDAAFCTAAESCEVPLVDIASFVGVDTFDIIDLPFMFKPYGRSAAHLNSLMRIFLSERQVDFWLALISRGRPPMLLRATIHSQLLARYAPSKAG